MFGVAEVALAFLLTGKPQPLRRADEDMFINFDTSELTLLNDPSVVLEYANPIEPPVLVTDIVEKAIAEDLSSVHQVKSVLIGASEDGVCIWIGIDNPVPEIRQRIFDKQLSLILAFPECDFDFNIIPTGGRDIRDFVTDHARVTYERQS